jgi:hypothetical protein
MNNIARDVTLFKKMLNWFPSCVLRTQPIRLKFITIKFIFYKSHQIIFPNYAVDINSENQIFAGPCLEPLLLIILTSSLSHWSYYDQRAKHGNIFIKSCSFFPRK